MKDGKTLLTSKTFWVNLLALIAIILNHLYPTLVLTPETTGYILIGINFVLRLITKEPVIWTK